jgi:hypothetical protein
MKETMIDGLAVFIVEEKAIELGITDKLIDLIAQQGFYILNRKILTSSNIKNLKSQKNLVDYPCLKAVDCPKIIVVAFDFLPISLSTLQQAEYPSLDNARLLTKQKINKYFHHCQPNLKKINLLHSTDNSQDAWHFLEIVMPDEIEPITEQITTLSQSFATHYPIQRDLTSFYRRRSKLELIEYQGSLAVKKTFRPGCERFFERELFVMKNFSQMRPQIPTLLEYGSFFIISPYYEDTLRFDSSCEQIPLSVAKQAMEILYFFYKQGYALIDFHPGNLIIDREQGLKVIDFEFLYRYKVKPKSLKECYDLAGIPSDFEGDRPLRSFKRKGLILTRSYETDWKPYIGLELDILLDKIT